MDTKLLKEDYRIKNVAEAIKFLKNEQKTRNRN